MIAKLRPGSLVQTQLGKRQFRRFPGKGWCSTGRILHLLPLSSNSYFLKNKQTKQQSHHIKPWMVSLSSIATHGYWKQPWIHDLCGYFCHNWVAIAVCVTGEKIIILNEDREQLYKCTELLLATIWFHQLFKSPSSSAWYGLSGLNALQIIQIKLAMVAIDIFIFHYFFRRHLTAVALVRRHFSVAI